MVSKRSKLISIFIVGVILIIVGGSVFPSMQDKLIVYSLIILGAVIMGLDIIVGIVTSARNKGIVGLVLFLLELLPYQ